MIKTASSLLTTFVFGAVLAASAPAYAQTSPTTLCINEGATTNRSIADLQKQYEPLAKLISSVSSKSSVTVKPFVSVGLFEDEIKTGLCDYVFGKTIDSLARAIESDKYNVVVKDKNPYVAGIIVAKGKDFKTPKDLVGRDILVPPSDTFTAQLLKSYLKSSGMPMTVKDTLDTFPTKEANAVTVRHIKWQEAVSSTVGMGWYSFGAVNPTLLKDWESKGGRVLVKMPPQPGWSILVKKDISPKSVNALKDALLTAAESEDGKSVLKAVKLEGMVVAQNAEYLSVLKYLAH